MQAAVADLSAEELAWLERDWQLWSRDDQLPPATDAASPWRTWLVLGGRGAGKTRAGAEWTRRIVFENASVPGATPLRIALVGEGVLDRLDR